MLGPVSARVSDGRPARVPRSAAKAAQAAGRTIAMINRLKKIVLASTKPAFWPALAKRIMPGVEHIGAIATLSPQTLIDVGANKGQFSLVARYLFPNVQIHAFEPLPDAARLYQAVVSGPRVLHPIALGARNGTIKFFVTSRADSSSTLPPSAAQYAAYGVSASHSIEVAVGRMADRVDVAALRRPILVKIDVQGSELEVLKGAEEVLSLLDAIYCEVSFVQLYEGQPLAGDVIAYLSARGFDLRGIFNLSNTRKFGPTQADLLFCQKPSPT